MISSDENLNSNSSKTYKNCQKLTSSPLESEPATYRNLMKAPTAFRRQFFHQRTQPPSTPGISSRVPNAQRVDPTPCEDLTWATTREEPFGRRNESKKTGHKMRSKWRICLDIDWHPRIPQSILKDWKWKTYLLSCVIWCGKSGISFHHFRS